MTELFPDHNAAYEEQAAQNIRIEALRLAAKFGTNWTVADYIENAVAVEHYILNGKNKSE